AVLRAMACRLACRSWAACSTMQACSPPRRPTSWPTHTSTKLRRDSRVRERREYMHRHPHVLNASCNLLGVSFFVVGALKLSNANARSYADEVAWGSAALFLLSVVASYWAIRNND